MEDQNTTAGKPDALVSSENYSAQLNVAEQLLDKTEEVHEDHTDYSELDKEGILRKAEELLHTTDVRKAQESLNRLRDTLDALIQAERPAQIREWVDAGNDARDFRPPADPAKAALQSVMQRFRVKREEERRRAEEENWLTCAESSRCWKRSRHWLKQKRPMAA